MAAFFELHGHPGHGVEMPVDCLAGEENFHGSAPNLPYWIRLGPTLPGCLRVPEL
jgi:hypothetical protein